MKKQVWIVLAIIALALAIIYLPKLGLFSTTPVIIITNCQSDTECGANQYCSTGASICNFCPLGNFGMWNGGCFKCTDTFYGNRWLSTGGICIWAPSIASQGMTLTGQMPCPVGWCIDTITSCKTGADIDCDKTISYSELLTYAGLWVSNSITYAELLQAANAWIGG